LICCSTSESRVDLDLCLGVIDAYRA
jgi:NADPH2:quinone reductase